MRIIACSWGLLAFPAALAAQAEQTLPAGVAEAFDCYTALPGQLVPVLRKAQDEASADTTAAELQPTFSAISVTVSSPSFKRTFASLTLR